jgi:WD40 repeat protein
MALVPDASAVAVFEAFRDEVSLWELPSGRLRWTTELPHPGNFLRLGGGQLAFSPDGKMLVLSPDRGEMRVLEARTGRSLHSLGRSEHGPVAFSPDGRKLAYAQRANVKVHDLETGKPLSDWTVESWAGFLVWSADGRALLVHDIPTADGDRRDHLSWWDVATGKQLRARRLDWEAQSWGSLSPDGKQVVILKDDIAQVHDLEGGRERLRTPVDMGLDPLPRFSSNGRRLLGVKNDVLHIWDTQTWKLLHSLPVKPAGVAGCDVSADGSLVVFGSSRDSAIHVWDLRKNQPLCEFAGHRTGPLLVAFSPDGREVVTTSSQCSSTSDKSTVPWSLRRWDAVTGEEKRRVVKDMGEVKEVVLSGDGRQVGLVLGDCMLALWDAERGRELRRWQLPHVEITAIPGRVEEVPGCAVTCTSYTFTRDGRELLAGELLREDKATVYRWDLTTGKELPALVVRGADTVVLPDSRPLHDRWLPMQIFIFSRLQLMDVKTGRLGPRFPPGDRGTSDLAITADGRTLAALSMNATKAELWEVASGTSRGEVSDVTFYAGKLALSPDSRLLAATALGDDEILLWDLAAGKPRAVLKGHRGDITSLAFSPDSRRLVSGAEDNVAYIWDVTDSTPAVRLDDEQLDHLWRDLHSPDGAAAYHAIWRLAGDPEHGVPFLRRHLLTPSADGPRMARLIEQLSDDSFKVREAASTELARFGTLAVPALVEAKKGKQSAEAQTRINGLLSRLPAGVAPSAQLVGIRVIESLERAGTPEARKVLEEIAKQEMWGDEIQSTLRRMGGPARAPRE